MHCKLKQYQVHHADRKNKELQNVGRAGEMEECEGGKDWLGIKFLPVSHEITLHRSLAPVETWAEKTLQPSERNFGRWRRNGYPAQSI